jgi:putative transcriptional regulator
MGMGLALLLASALALGAAFGPGGPGGPRRPGALSRAPQRRLRLCQEEPPKLDDKDWRAFRARLVAAQQAEGGGEGGGGGASTTSEGGFMYATPLIEQGSVILGGTDQEFGFALRQQYFHKCVILLLSHDDGFTKGIILNRPSALTLDGWRLWFGGDVAQGGLFRKAEPWKTIEERASALLMVSAASSGLEMVCLHSLTSEAARRLSLPVISGVWQTSFEVAKSLVDDGEAAKEDFCVFAGYAGWGPTQLQGEVERDSWFLAAADSSVLLQELLQQAREVPTNRAGDGLRTWDTLMEGIGKAEQASSSLQHYARRPATLSTPACNLRWSGLQP